MRRGWSSTPSIPAEPRTEWSSAPRLPEDEYNVADAVVVGSYLIALLRHADRVGIACQAQLVNAIAPIRAEPGAPAWRQTIVYPFRDAARLARGQVLKARPTCRSDSNQRYGEVPLVDAVATHDPSSGDSLSSPSIAASATRLPLNWNCRTSAATASARCTPTATEPSTTSTSTWPTESSWCSSGGRPCSAARPCQARPAGSLLRRMSTGCTALTRQRAQPCELRGAVS